VFLISGLTGEAAKEQKLKQFAANHSDISNGSALWGDG
jgi:hypothetical protein